MNVLSRDFTTKERVAILLLSLVLVGLVYYWFVDRPVREGIAAANAERDALMIELDGVNAKLLQLQKMEKEIEELGELQDQSRIPSYNNTSGEMDELNAILQSSTGYTISFGDVKRNGDLIRRDFHLQFTTNGYDEAKRIISSLAGSELRCLIGNITFKDNLRSSAGSSSYRSLYQQYYGDFVRTITMSVEATFYETMYDGVADGNLPKSG